MYKRLNHTCLLAGLSVLTGLPEALSAGCGYVPGASYASAQVRAPARRTPTVTPEAQQLKAAEQERTAAQAAHDQAEAEWLRVSCERSRAQVRLRGAQKVARASHRALESAQTRATPFVNAVSVAAARYAQAQAHVAHLGRAGPLDPGHEAQLRDVLEARAGALEARKTERDAAHAALLESQRGALWAPLAPAPGGAPQPCRKDNGEHWLAT